MKMDKKILYFFGSVVIGLFIIVVLVGGFRAKESPEGRVVSNWQPYTVIAQEMCMPYVTYTPMGTPDINSSFKSWMPKSSMNKKGSQYKFLSKWGYVDHNGFYRCKAENDFGIYDDYYLVAMGSYYSNCLGEKFRITTDTGNVFYVVIGEYKADKHTNSTNQYTLSNNCIVEFIVDKPSLNKDVKKMGSANVYMPLNGRIICIEKMKFVKN